MPCSTGVVGLFKGATQLTKTCGKAIRVPPFKPELKIGLILLAAHLQFFVKVYPFGIGSLVMQQKGPDKGDTEDQDETNNTYWIACHAYL